MTHINMYPARFEQDEDGRILVTFPDLPEALTDGADFIEASKEAVDCLEEAIAGRINRGEAIPVPGALKGSVWPVSLSPDFTLKVLLHSAWKEQGISKTEFAQVLGVDEKEARRLLDPHYGSKLPKMSEALGALGKRIVIDIEDIPNEVHAA